MRMSESKRSELYDAIKEPIMQLRIYAARRDVHGNPLSTEEIDDRLFRLEGHIWAAAKNALNLED